jgi:hypothetical protein
MRGRRLRTGSLLTFALVLAASAVGAACSEMPRIPGPATGTPSSLRTTVPGQYIVTLAPGADVKAITGLYGRFGIKDVRDLGQNNFLMILTDDPGLSALEELRGNDASIKTVQPNFIYHSNVPGSAQ